MITEASIGWKAKVRATAKSLGPMVSRFHPRLEEHNYTMKTTVEGMKITLHKGVQVIKFNRPHKKNAITPQMYEAIANALNESATDDNVVITALTGEGDYYSSGNDISSYTTFNAEDMSEAVKIASNRVRSFVSAFINFPKILVAVVNGPAIGIAATTLGLCDAVYASDKAKFITPFTRLGLVAEGCSSYTYPKIMGKSKAGEMLYFGYEMSAEEAKQCGLVSQVYPNAMLSREVWPKLEKLAELPVKSMMYSKRLVCQWEREELHKANALECEQLEERWQSEECLDAIVKFLSKQSKL